jgi:MoaA/NifB/PqqE/SkfB family radical SAM enzyme
MLPKNQKRTANRQWIYKGIIDGTRAYSGPEHVVIDLTNRCNNTCNACWTGTPLLGDKAPAPLWHKQELESDRVVALIDELHALGTSIVRFTGGGEPFMHPGIFGLIRTAKSKGLFCSVTTNLTLIDLASAEELITSGLDELTVSVWASNSNEYVKTHPNQSERSFDSITEVLMRIAYQKRVRRYTSPSYWLKQPLPRVNLVNVICNLNYQSVEAMFDYALKIGAESIYYTVVDTIEGSTDTLLLSDDQREEVFQMCLAIERKNSRLSRRRKIFLDNFTGFKARLQQETARYGEYDHSAVDSIPCYIGWMFCRIMADGRVAPCCRGVHLPMGDIYEKPFAEIWYSKKYDNFRRKAKNCVKSDPYFKNMDCRKTCDNHMHNLEMDHRLKTGIF